MSQATREALKRIDTALDRHALARISDDYQLPVSDEERAYVEWMDSYTDVDFRESAEVR